MVSEAPITTATLTCTPLVFDVPGNGECRVDLVEDAPPGGLLFNVLSSSIKVTVPQTAFVPVGSNSGRFVITTSRADTDQMAVVVTATGSGISVSTVVTLNAPPGLSSMSCSPTTIDGSGGVAVCSIGLTRPSSAALTASVTSNTPRLTVPASVTFAANQTTTTFQAIAGAVTAQETANVAATLSTGSVSANISLNPSSRPALSVPGTISASAGESVHFGVSASDPRGLALTLTASGLPSGATFDTASGAFVGQPVSPSLALSP